MTHDRNLALLSAALDAAARGWHVFPLVPDDKPPAIRNWAERATTDPERITRCWSHAPYNIGIATGPSQLVVVDLDTPKGPDDLPPAGWSRPGISNGLAVLLTLWERHDPEGLGDLVMCEPFDGYCEMAPATHIVKTPSGGMHLYYVAPGDAELRNTAGKLGWKIDTRAHGGYVVAPGSTITGKPVPYTTVHEAVVKPLPGWIVEQLRPAPLPPQQPITVALASDRRGKWLRAAVDGELERVTRAREGGRNKALYIASVALGQLVAGGEMGTSEVTEWLTAAARQAGQGEREARRTIESGLRAGANRPRQVAA
ncbi:bifunctional DNA primase/polymerase [Streptomyces sp. NBC_00154]|uniref:bifunctional DNA primase/polymerase n=1 Tax=Streptomyces sp. NBC_00154 TaxID=2975670 RepID=UPI0022536515|nr:bifunctional DNA primase/polymerase [Streptomyces sp. NBC_00154]MCX5310673.1 bifunctional DNA primase/polymerase [Streptomyces sp. NBC_00154]